LLNIASRNINLMAFSNSFKGDLHPSRGSP
jgi:hypothetical protein